MALTLSSLAGRSLRHYWRTNLAVLVGVGVAVSVLAGALLVGDSVRASLRDLALGRLGRTAFAIRAPEYVDEAFVARLVAQPEFASAYAACPIIAVDGFVTHEPSRARAAGVAVYGVDERFFAFHGRDVAPPDGNGAYISDALARETGAAPGDAILVRVEKRSAIPAESLYGRKEDVARTIRLTVAGVLPPADMGEFSLGARQGAVRAVFASLARVQRALDHQRQVNTILVSSAAGESEPAGARAGVEALSQVVERAVRFDDVGITIDVLPAANAVVLERASGIIGDALGGAGETMAGEMGLSTRPVFAYVANSIRSGDRSIPYSVVAALDLDAIAPGAAARPAGAPPPGEPVVPDDQSPFDDPPVVLNDWAARDLGVRVGDQVWISYYLWEQEGSLRTEMARFRLAAIVPIRGAAADTRLVPDYPGITGAESLADWDPPFPIDLSLVRPEDDDYWRRYQTTPKAFIPLDTGRRLWASRHGSLTSLRVLAPGRDLDSTAAEYRERLRAALGPEALGLATSAVRADSLRASEGATDFGEYFTYFSFFLVVSALLLASLFFRLGVEQRAREIGILRATGFPIATIRGLFLREAAAVSAAGGLVGVAGASGYAALVMYGLRTWWIGAVGTTALAVHVAPLPLALGVAGGVAAAIGAIVLTLRRAVRATPRSLLAGWAASAPGDGVQRPLLGPLSLALASGTAGLALVAGALATLVPAVVGFFGAGSLLLVAALAYLAAWLRRRDHHLIEGSGWEAVSRLGFRNAAYRPGRSVLAVALVASAAFVIVAVDAFRHRGESATLARDSGTGGFPLMAEAMVPVVYDLNTITGRQALGVELPPELPLSGARFTRLRLRPGDDASCLNLYRPQNPRILGAGPDLIDSHRFRFGRTLAETPDELAYPWTLLDRVLPNGIVPVIADANSMTYVLHVGVGDEMSVLDGTGRPVTLRFVAALADSIFQSDVLMSESHFTRLFPERQGHQVFLIDVEPRWAPALAERLEAGLEDLGFDVVSTPERLASYHQVENTYLSTFQTLGALGLLLGTFGLATVMFRNVLERRREFALLRAVGYHTTDFSVMILAENLLLLGFGLAFGAGAALVAIAPAFLERRGQLPGLALVALLGAVLVAGLLSSLVATVAAVRAPLLASLRAD